MKLNKKVISKAATDALPDDDIPVALEKMTGKLTPDSLCDLAYNEGHWRGHALGQRRILEELLPVMEHFVRLADGQEPPIDGCSICDLARAALDKYTVGGGGE